MKGNYNNSKIYKIYTTDNNIIYYGATTKKLCCVMSYFRSKYLKHKEKPVLNIGDVKTLYELFDNVGSKNCIIELIKNFECNNKEEQNRELNKYKYIDCNIKI